MVKNLKRFRRQVEREFGKAEAQKYPFKSTYHYITAALDATSSSAASFPTATWGPCF